MSKISENTVYLFIYFSRMILCLYCFQVLYSHAREARVVYSQTALVTKLFVILPLGLMLKLVNDMLNIANIYYSARHIKT